MVKNRICDVTRKAEVFLIRIFVYSLITILASATVAKLELNLEWNHDDRKAFQNTAPTNGKPRGRGGRAYVGLLISSDRQQWGNVTEFAGLASRYPEKWFPVVGPFELFSALGREI